LGLPVWPSTLPGGTGEKAKNRKEVIENAKGDVCLGHCGRGSHGAATSERAND
jgi:hypothetical protein